LLPSSAETTTSPSPSLQSAEKAPHNKNNNFQKGAKRLKLYGARIKIQMKFGSEIKDMMKSCCIKGSSDET
jgi:hypothetical protein